MGVFLIRNRGGWKRYRPKIKKKRVGRGEWGPGGFGRKKKIKTQRLAIKGGFQEG